MSTFSLVALRYEFNQGNGFRSSRRLKFPVQSSEWKSAITCELQVSRVVDGQLCVNRRREEQIPRCRCTWSLDPDGQRSQEFSEFKDVANSDPTTTHRHDHPVHHLARPVCWYDRFIAGAQPLEKCFGLRSSFIPKTPRECRRSVNHEDAQYFLPSLISSLIGMPPSVLRSRNCRMRSTASAGVIRGFGGIGRSAASLSSARSTTSSGEPAWASWCRSASAWGVRLTVMFLNVSCARVSLPDVGSCYGVRCKSLFAGHFKNVN